MATSKIDSELKDNALVKGKEAFVQNMGTGKGPIKLILDSMQTGVEANYFWILRFMQNRVPHGLGCSGKEGRIEKLRDLYTAGEASSYWGSQEQKRAAQIDKFSAIMQSIGGMLKSTFQMLREIRIIDERLEYYKGYNEKDDSSSVALKSVWVDMVEGGAKNPGSVYGLASQVGFTVLPDLFFKFHPKDQKDVDKILKRLKKEKMNRKVREILGRKLKQFIIWKQKTEKEITTRKNFMLKYLRQHFNAMKLNMNWLKPYIRNIGRLEFEDISHDPEVLKSLETAKTEVEILGVLNEYDYADPRTSYITTYKFKKYKACILIRMSFVALPQMSFQKEYSRGAIQTGRTIIQVEYYAATEKEIEEYKKYIDHQDTEILTSLHASLDAMKEELDKYLEEAGELIKKEKKEVKKESITKGILEPFTSAISGFKEVLNIKSKPSKLAPKHTNEKKLALKLAKEKAATIYDIYKKTHKMLAE